MWIRSLLIWAVLVAVGVWASMGLGWSSETVQWIAKGAGIVLILAGVTIALTRDAFDQRAAHVSGGGAVLLGVAQWLPTPWSLGVLLAALVLMWASAWRRWRHAKALTSS
jgi:hypothetical protein